MIFTTHQGINIEIDSEDYKRINNHKWYRNGRHNLTNENRVTIGRFILNYYGPLEVDHKNRNILDNQKWNLRLATRQQQLANRGPIGKNKYKGVSFDTAKYIYRVHICIDHKIKHIGCFKDIIEAAKAYDRIALKTWGEFAYLNFPPGE